MRNPDRPLPAYHNREVLRRGVVGVSILSALGQSRPMYSAPVPNNVRYASNSDQNIALQ
jgi:hypothetical protein